MKHEMSNGTPELTAKCMERAKRGDQDALAELYATTELEIYRTVHAILKDEELCRDVQQDAYLRAFSRLEELRDPAAFLPWLRQIAVNEARMQLRRKRPLLFSELSVEPDAGEPELPDLRAEASPELSLERKENARLVREILDGLPEGQRLLLGMFYYEQIPIKEIAADTGLSEGTVKAQLFRGRKRVETEVKRLEEKGVKLYGLSPLPFLLALLRRQEPAAEAGKTLMAETFTKAGIAPVAEAAAVHVGRSFFQTVLGKVVLGIIAAGVVGVGAAGWRWYQENFRYGDWQPPSETLEINLHVDTDEDLTTAPTDELTLPTEPETNEDLVPDTTEPVETTEPTDPTDPVEATEPVGADAHIGPDPTDPTVPADPTPSVGAGDHTGPGPAETTEPTDPEPQVPEPLGAPQITGYRWPFEENAYDLATLPYQHALGYAFFSTINGGIPELYTDNPDMVIIEPQGNYTDGNLKPNETGYLWLVSVVGSGYARIFCALNGEIYREFTITNPEHPPKLIREKVSVLSTGSGDNAHNRMEDCLTGSRFQIDLVVQGEIKPEITTDHPEIASIMMEPYTGGEITKWYEHGFFVYCRIVGAGDAIIYVRLNGEIVASYNIHATEQDAAENPVDTEATEAREVP